MKEFETAVKSIYSLNDREIDESRNPIVEN